MAARLISYDLRKPGRDYPELYSEIKSLGTGWWHCLESVWIVKTTLTPVQIRDRLRMHVDTNDKVAVFNLGSGWGTLGLDDDCNSWLRDNL